MITEMVQIIFMAPMFIIGGSNKEMCVSMSNLSDLQQRGLNIKSFRSVYATLLKIN
jgi:hypothetical protein